MSARHSIAIDGMNLCGGYRPTFVSSLGLWICGDNVVADSSNRISQATDLGPLGGHATQTTDGYKPLRVLNARNGHAAIQADGTDDSLNTAALGLVQPLHYFIAAAWTVLSLGANRYLTDGFPTLNTGDIFQPSGAGTASTYFGASGPSAAFTSGSWCIIEVVANGASSKIAINGGAQTTGNVGTANPNGITFFTSATRLSPNFASALLGEATIFRAELTGTDRLRELARLSTKWAINLAS